MIATAMAAEKECSPLGQYVNISIAFFIHIIRKIVIFRIIKTGEEKRNIKLEL